MNWLKKGPQLRMPKLKKPNLSGPAKKRPAVKLPSGLADFYYDLRDRRLLLPIALVIVAIASVPFLLGDSESDGALPPASDIGVTAPGKASASLTVVEATPGLRDYRKRLGGRSATNPFKQRHTALPGSAQIESTAASGGSSSGESVTIEEDSISVEAESGGSGGSGGSGDRGGGTGGGPDTDGSGLRLIEYRYTIQVSHTEGTSDGGQKMSEPQVRRGVRPLAQLPGEKLPLITVAGVNLENGRVYFLVSRDVSSLEGDFTCKARTPDGVCELLEVEAGFPFETSYGDGERYRFKVTDIDAIWGKKLGGSPSSSRAAFGTLAVHP